MFVEEIGFLLLLLKELTNIRGGVQDEKWKKEMFGIAILFKLLYYVP